MPFAKAFIPYKAYWSTPFSKWQGSFAHLNAVTFAADVTRDALAARRINAATFDGVFLGLTVVQKGSFYGAPWLAGLIGAGDVSGPTINQACATSARVIGNAAAEIELGQSQSILCITADRTSNGPHITYPNPNAPGGKPDTEDWVWDNFNCDPWADNAMLDTAENVARQGEFSIEEQHEMTLLRYQQYQDALKDDAAFHKRYMITPLQVKDEHGRKVVATVTADEGIFPTSAEGLAKLKPVLPNGSVTFGSQTHPADGNAGMILTTQDNAREMSADKSISIQVIGVGSARASKGYMGQAPVPAARAALKDAGIELKDVKVIKTHNPFAVNDLYFCKETGLPWEALNHFGSSLIFGHPQGPTGMRLIIEAIEELVMLGGGYGLFAGCAAGDSAMAVVVKVGVRRVS